MIVVMIVGNGERGQVTTIQGVADVKNFTKEVLKTLRACPIIEKIAISQRYVNEPGGESLKDYFEYVRSLELRLREIEE